MTRTADLSSLIGRIEKLDGPDRGALYDKRGIPIERGDIVKVFHFVGARRKRNFMYKQCLGFKLIGQNADVPYMMFGHLNFIEDSTARDGPYLQKPDGRILPDYEIVQSIDANFEDRPRALLRSLGEEDE